jgi:SAM-dependent methyltransferase
MTPAMEVYGRLLRAPHGGRVRVAGGRLAALPVERWLGPVTQADRMVVAACEAPVLDVGCGPGRLLEALEQAGKPALGVDLSPEAVGLARRRGGRAIHGCFFSDLPAEPRWRTILLLDGNIGIGGDPVALLRRVAALLHAGGEAIVEVAPSGFPTRRTRVRIEGAGQISEWFPWAEVSEDGIGATAAAAGMREAGSLAGDGRVFARLRR